jgi:hypothetical protein
MDKKTEEEIRAEVERVMQELTLLEREAQARGEQFVRLDEETLRRKIAGEEANSPYFGGLGVGSASPGGTANITAYVYNPDPVYHYYYGYLVFGPSGLIQNTDLSLTAVDTRLPRYTRNLFVPPNSSMNQTYPIPIPPDFPPGLGGYLFNLYMVDIPAFSASTVIARLTYWIVVQ